MQGSQQYLMTVSGRKWDWQSAVEIQWTLANQLEIMNHLGVHGNRLHPENRGDLKLKLWWIANGKNASSPNLHLLLGLSESKLTQESMVLVVLAGHQYLDRSKFRITWSAC